MPASAEHLRIQQAEKRVAELEAALRERDELARRALDGGAPAAEAPPEPKREKLRSASELPR